MRGRANLGYKKDAEPISESMRDESSSLAHVPGMKESEVDEVTKVLLSSGA